MSTKSDDAENAENATVAPSKPEEKVKKRSFRKFWKHFLKLFRLNGYFNYVFIYGSWEVIKARKVGTTHTVVDYVVYRLFNPIILSGAYLFNIVQQENFERFFSMAESWLMVIHITYSFIFLKNVLANNLHRDKVKHRQKIPEKLVVTDEIDKGGNKFYVCRRYSILPTESLDNTNKILYFLFNIVTTCNFAMYIGRFLGYGKTVIKWDSENEGTRITLFGLSALAETIVTPIPKKLAHVIYPFMLSIIYLIFGYQMYLNYGMVIYSDFDYRDENLPYYRNVFRRYLVLAISHIILTGVTVLRDFVIAMLDDSRTPSQIQNLRSQKRLARRKIMTYLEDRYGRVIGVALEKQAYVPKADEVIQTEKYSGDNEPENGDDDDSSSTPSSAEDVNDEESQIGYLSNNTSVTQVPVKLHTGPLTGIMKPSKHGIHTHPGKSGKIHPRFIKPLRLSSSSSDEEIKKRKELDALNSIKFPSPPGAEETRRRSTKTSSRKSGIPKPIKKLGFHLRARDSKEDIIHHHQEHAAEPRVQTPPTPPYIQLVQTMVHDKVETSNAEDKNKRGGGKNIKGILHYKYTD